MISAIPEIPVQEALPPKLLVKPPSETSSCSVTDSGGRSEAGRRALLRGEAVRAPIGMLGMTGLLYYSWVQTMQLKCKSN
jgi:hypothetical protein